MRRPRRTPLILLAAFGCLPLALATPATGNAITPAERSPDPAREIPDLVNTLRNPDAGADARERAARALLALVPAHDALTAVSSILRTDDDAPRAARTALLQAIAASPAAEPALWPAVSPLTTDPNSPLAPDAIAALAPFRTRAAAERLVRLLDPDTPETARRAAFAALERMTGRSDLPRTADVWRDWWNEHRRLDDRRWQRELIRGLAGAADRLDRRRNALEQRLVDAFRRLHLATPAEERSALIASMLLEEVPALRALGFDLAAREISASTELTSAVGEAALRLLTHPSADVRAEAAVLANRLAPDGVERAIHNALRAERDPRAVAPILLAVARWPAEESVDTVVGWLEHGADTRPPAAEAAWALQRAGLLTGESTSRRVRDTLAPVPPDTLSAASMRLLAVHAREHDARNLYALLTHDDPALRARVAEALTHRPDALAAIVHAAETDPSLFDHAARAIRRHQPTETGLQRLATLPAPDEDTRRAAIVAAARNAGAGPAIAVAQSLRDLRTREAVLTAATAPDDTPIDRLRARALLMLAETRLALREPASALAALDSHEHADEQRERARQLRLAALIMLERFAEAIELQPDDEHEWLTAAAISAPENTAEALYQALTDWRDAQNGTVPDQIEALIRALEARVPRDRDVPANPGSD